MSSAAELTASLRALLGCALIEKDVSGDVLPVWSYPQGLADGELGEAVMLARCGLQGEKILARQHFHRHRSQWVYSHVELCSNDAGGTLASDRRVIAFQVCVFATDFHPEKYAMLAAALARGYALGGGDPVIMLECYLQIFSRGRVKDPQKPDAMLYDLSAFADTRAPMLASPLSALVKLLGENFVLLWTALILKKRIVFLSDRLGLMQKLIRAVPLAAFHRANWDILRPFVAIEESDAGDEGGVGGGAVSWHDADAANRAQIEDLRDAGHVVAGFTNGEFVREHEELYDLLVDCNNRTAMVSPHASSDFLMTSIHKGVHTTVTGIVEKDGADIDLVKALAVKTKDILTKLESLKRDHESGGSFVDLEAIHAAGVTNANLAQFLFNVAVAEGLTRS